MHHYDNSVLAHLEMSVTDLPLWKYNTVLLCLIQCVLNVLNLTNNSQKLLLTISLPPV